MGSDIILLPPEAMSTPRELRFSDDQAEYAGLFLNYDRAHTVLVLPDWRGHRTDYAMRRGVELGRKIDANVVVSDLFTTSYRPTDYAGDAEHWVAAALANPRALRQCLTGYVQALTAHIGIAPSSVIVVGYCLGGALAFEMGRSDLGLCAVVCIHGIPASTAPIQTLRYKTRFLAIHGASDPIIELEHLTRFQTEMTRAKVDWTSLALGHVRHGFTDEETDPHGHSQRYDQTASRRTLGMLAAFLSLELSP
ncbi:dienelactone hydrolase family protein [Verminephrobacter aporrectodeae]|uniref:dienelactone hydrolase family protein n=1 Tax=Verminephrobacter aporrectodeae TaxID=1110389 RepID=UPI0022443547|nr:alpha/beta fold hydrolase [Verminephrobacter aporrectodeae]